MAARGLGFATEITAATPGAAAASVAAAVPSGPKKRNRRPQYAPQKAPYNWMRGGSDRARLRGQKRWADPQYDDAPNPAYTDYIER